MARTKGPRGGGFLGGLVAGLTLSALGLGVLAVNAPAPLQPGEMVDTALNPAQQQVAPAPGPLEPTATEPRANVTPSTDAASPDEGAGAVGVGQGAEPGRNVADGPEPAGALRATPAPETPAGAAGEPSQADAREAAPAPEAQAAVVRPPDETPASPPLVRNAAAFASSGAPLVSVILTGIEPASEQLSRVFELGAPITLALDPAVAGGEALGARAREAGFEVVSRGARVDSNAVGAYAVGVARKRWDAEARAQARESGMMALALIPASGDGGAEGSPGATDADVTVGFHLDEAASAERVFQTLQEATRRAGENGGVAVALAATDAALIGLARWLAVTEADAAPVSALMP